MLFFNHSKTFISNEDFNKMYMMSKQLTDYNPDINERGEMEEDIGVPIVFDEKAEEENNEEDEDMDEEEQLAINEILAEDIDSEWLKIEIGKYFDNIDEVLSKESQVLEYLAIEDLISLLWERNKFAPKFYIEPFIGNLKYPISQKIEK